GKGWRERIEDAPDIAVAREGDVKLAIRSHLGNFGAEVNTYSYGSNQGRRGKNLNRGCRVDDHVPGPVRDKGEAHYATQGHIRDEDDTELNLIVRWGTGGVEEACAQVQRACAGM